MTVRIGKIPLVGVQTMYTEEARTLVEQKVPEQQGCAFQDMGREPVTVFLSGFLLGEDAPKHLEVLRLAQTKAEPMPFAADIAVGSNLTNVIIEDFRVNQAAGYSNRYFFKMRLREHTEPPKSKEADIKPVDESAKKDAKNWEEGKKDAAAVLKDPAKLPQKLDKNPQLENHLDTGKLADAVAQKMDKLSPDQAGGVLASLGKMEPAKGISFIDSLKSKGKLGSLLAKLAEAGMKFVEMVKNLPWGAIAAALSGGLEFLAQLKKVGAAATDVFNAASQLEWPKGFNELVPVKGNTP
jgi:hypothetical protein